MKSSKLGERRRRHWAMATAGLIGLAGLLGGGCASDPPTAGKHVVVSMLDVPAYDFDMPAGQLVERVRAALGSMQIPIEKSEKGTILTGFKDYPGAWHIARRWEEQTRYRITVYPLFDDPTGKSHLEVVQETRTRASDKQPNWYTWAEVQRPERAADLARKLRDQITGSAK